MIATTSYVRPAAAGQAAGKETLWRASQELAQPSECAQRSRLQKREARVARRSPVASRGIKGKYGWADAREREAGQDVLLAKRWRWGL